MIFGYFKETESTRWIFFSKLILFFYTFHFPFFFFYSSFTFEYKKDKKPTRFAQKVLLKAKTKDSRKEKKEINFEIWKQKNKLKETKN
jgi:acyl-CoA thioesterase FadM